MPRSSNVERAFRLLESLQSEVNHLPIVEESVVTAAENHLGVRFPGSYRQLLLEQFGAFAIGELRVLGLGGPWDRYPSIVWATELLRAVSPHAPHSLVTLDVQDNGYFVCLECTTSERLGEDRVLLWDPDAASPTYRPQLLANDFGGYLLQELNERIWFQAGMARLKWHLDHPEVEWDHQTGGRLPRNHLWRPYRFCVQDVILGVTVLRHSRELNCLEVDVFLTAAIPEYEADSGARAMTLLLLSEAYKCGGTMEIRFTEHVEDAHVPQDLTQLAEGEGVQLHHIGDGIVAPNEAHRLYSALTGFSSQLQLHMEGLQRSGRLSVPLICYAIHHGVWDRIEVEAAILANPRPESLLGGQAQPEQRLLYLHDVLYGRAAVLFGSLDRHLRYRTHPHDGGVFHLEDDERTLDLQLDGGAFAATYRCLDEAIVIPWVEAPAGNAATGNRPHMVPPGQPFTVLVRARDAADMSANLESDLQGAAQLGLDRVTGLVYVLVPQDFFRLPRDLQTHLIDSRPRDVGLLVYPQYVSVLDDDVARRLKASRTMRA